MSDPTNSREQFASRLGFILMTAGCAIGLGNVWRFPYIAGQYGGGLFVCLYLFFLAILGFPVMMMELSLGRAGRSTFPGAFRNLQNPSSRFRWSAPAYILFAGNMILLMFYTVVTGWLFSYAIYYIDGSLQGKTAADFGMNFDKYLSSPAEQTVATMIMLFLTILVCLGGVRKTIEKVIKVMMGGLFLLLLALVVQSLTLPNAMKGVEFLLKPDLNNFLGKNIFETIHAAMAQAFFTLSLGIGSIAICGSYIHKENSLPKEGIWIMVLDTLMAICSGLIIFPCCAAYSINPNAGPPLIFITLPNVFQNMAGGRFWGILFFAFLTIAALSTLIAVFENLVAFGMEEWKLSRKKSCIGFGILLALLSLPCILGFNLWKNFHPLGKNSNVLDLEDFIVSDNLLPLGALYMTIFCMSRWGWGSDRFLEEVNTGKGWKLSRKLIPYMRYVLPVIILAIWLIGLAKRFNLLG
ncbi:MAG: sodium-dependent transporter [Lentisphaeria bacterium]|nr:sodium-dependent transporter [Lentisphaeria bacterium]